MATIEYYNYNDPFSKKLSDNLKCLDKVLKKRLHSDSYSRITNVRDSIEKLAKKLKTNWCDEFWVCFYRSDISIMWFIDLIICDLRKYKSENSVINSAIIIY